MDLYLFFLFAGFVYSSLLVEQTTVPSVLGRFGAVYLADTNRNVVIVTPGDTGVDTGYAKINDFVAYTPGGGWSTITSVGNSGYLPGSRLGHVAALLDDALYYGFGKNIGGDTWKLNLTTLEWANITPEECVFGSMYLPFSGSENCPPNIIDAFSVMVNSGPNAERWIIFGGIATGSGMDVSFSTTWIFNVRARTWRSVIYSSSGPVGRGGCAGAFYQNKLFVLGGYDYLTNAVADPYIWSLDLSDQSWTRNSLTGSDAISASITNGGHFPSAQKNNVLYVHPYVGAYSSNELFKINLITFHTTKIVTNFTSKQGVGLVLLNSILYYMGGRVTDMQVHMFSTLTEASSFDNSYYSNFPSAARYGFICSIIHNQVFMFGGISSETDNGLVLDIKTGAFRTICVGCGSVTMSGTSTVSTDSAQFVTLGNKIFVQGGIRSSNTVNSLLTIEVTSGSLSGASSGYVYHFTDISTSCTGDILPNKKLAGTVLLTSPATSSSIYNYMFMHGGGNDSGDTPDVYVINLSSYAVLKLSDASASVMDHCGLLLNGIYVSFGGITGSTELNSVYSYAPVFNIDGTISNSGSWISRSTWSAISSSAPSPRHASTCTAFRDRYMILYGGVSGVSTFSSDFWVLDSNSWSWNSLTVSWTPDAGRSSARMLIYNSRLYLFGGKSQAATFKAYIFRYLSDVNVNPLSGNDYACSINPFLYSCFSISKAVDLFSGNPGIMQRILLDSNVSYTDSSIFITNSIFIGSLTRNLAIWNCNSQNCLMIATSGTVYLSKISFSGGFTNGKGAKTNQNGVKFNNFGGVININAGALDISGCSFSESMSSKGGAMYISGDSRVVISYSNFSNLAAASFGGVFYVEKSTLSISNSIVRNNYVSAAISGSSISVSCSSFGGAIAALSATIFVENSEFFNNKADHEFSPIINTAPSACALSITSYGGAIYAFSSSLSLISSIFSNNAADFGGAIVIRGTTDISSGGLGYLGVCQLISRNSSFYNNNATDSDGGGVYAVDLGVVALHDSFFSGNAAARNGGGIFLESVGSFIFNSLLVSNIASSNGGGLFSSSTAYLFKSGCFFNNNVALNGGGGGIFWSRSLESLTVYVPDLSACSFSSNVAVYGGDKATVAVGLNIENSSQFNSIMQVSGMKISPSIVVYLVDYYSQVVASDSSKVVSAYPADVFSGSTNQPCAAGVATFSSLIVSSFPGNLSLGYFSCASSMGTGLITSSHVSVNVSLCPAGTYLFGTVCRSCVAGSFSNSTNSAECTLCPNGYYGSSFGLTTCSPCLSGSFANSYGHSTCSPCILGRYSSSNGSSECTLCLPGTYVSVYSATVCSNCTAGSNSEAGAAICNECRGGTYSSFNGSATCVNCPQGSYQKNSGKSYCLNCASGSVTKGAGELSCLSCDAGKYRNDTMVVCASCSAGFYSLTESSNCLECSVGKFQDKEGQGACKDCVLGTISSTNGSTLCTPCIPGYYQDQSGKSVCSACSVGTFLSNSGKFICDSCPAGMFTNITGSTVCFKCAAGSFSSGSASNCSLCDSGYFQPEAGRAQCIACPAGFYTSSSGLTACSPCDLGKYQSDSGSSKCYECLPGSFRNSDSKIACTACDPGKYSNSSGSAQCSLCLAGSFSIGGASNCTLCSSGTFQNAIGGAQCTPCSPGYFSSAPGSTTCSACEPGSFQASGGASTCFGCAPGSYTNDIKQCEAGTFSSNTGNSSCSACDVGSFSSAGASNCTLCNPGSFQNSPSQNSCNGCSAGTFSSTFGAVACVSCSDGYYQPSISQTSCLPCQVAFYSSGNGLFCNPCSEGTFSNETGKSSCFKCPAGHFSLSNSINCTSCSAGFSSVAGSGSCVACLAGQYSSPGGLCVSCPTGKFQNLAGKSFCEPCPINTFSSVDGSYDCRKCDAGKFNSASGLSLCYNCPVGYFCSGNSTTSESKSPCSLGLYQSEPGQPNCLPCVSGKYSSALNSSFCFSCIPGTFSSLSSSTFCNLCPIGSYTPTSGASECVKCPAGQYSLKLGSTACTRCPLYSQTSASGNCDCDATYYSYASSNDSFACLECPRGAFCDFASNVETIKSLPGYFPVSYSSNRVASDFKSCFNKNACSGGATYLSLSSSYDVFSANSTKACADTYTGPLCAVCASGYQQQFVCSPCPAPGSNNGYLIGIGVGFIFFALFYAHICTKKSEDNISSTILRIIVATLQFNALASRFDFSWPEALHDLLKLQLRATYVGQAVFSVQCSSQTTSDVSYFYISSVLFFFLPFIIALFVSLFYFLRIVASFDNQFDLQRAKAACYCLLFLALPAITQQTFDMLYCYQVGNDPSELYLVADMSQKCWTPEHKFFIGIIAIPMLLLYVIGIPLSAFLVLKKNIDQLDDPSVVIPFRFLFISYEPDYWYWQLIIMFRQLVMIILTVYSTDKIEAQALVAILICVISLASHSAARPYVSFRADWFEMYCLSTCFFTYYFGAFIYLLGPKSSWTTVFSVIIFFLNVVAVFLAVILFILARFYPSEEDDEVLTGDMLNKLGSRSRTRVKAEKKKSNRALGRHLTQVVGGTEMAQTQNLHIYNEAGLAPESPEAAVDGKSLLVGEVALNSLLLSTPGVVDDFTLTRIKNFSCNAGIENLTNPTLSHELISPLANDHHREASTSVDLTSPSNADQDALIVDSLNKRE